METYTITVRDEHHTLRASTTAYGEANRDAMVLNALEDLPVQWQVTVINRGVTS